MNFKQLVLRNVLRNGRTYATYFLSSFFSVVVFFVFALLYFHPELQKGLVASGESLSVLGSVGILAAQVVIVIMSIIFLGYTFSIFLKSRKHDFSVYLILGMSEKNLGRMVFFENSILGLAAIGSGILVSLIFSKLILLISQHMLALEQGMPFYLPTKPILLTVIIYTVIFLFIAVMTTSRIQTETLVEMSKSEDKPLPATQTKWYLSLVSLLVIGGGYGAVISFALCFRNGRRISLWLLLGCVLLTIFGTYLFFNQNSIRLFSFLKKRSLFFKRTNMLTISNLVYRMKTNGTMYFMIAIVASVAFVGIGTTMAIGGSDYASTQESSYAYVYRPSGALDGMVSGYHQNNVAFIKRTIEEAGFTPHVVEVLPLSVDYRSENSQWQYLEVIPLNLFNELARFETQEELSVPNDSSLLILGTSNSAVNEIKANKLDKRVVEGQIKYTLAEKEEAITYGYSTRRFNIASGALGVVSDSFYQKILAAKMLDVKKEPDQGYVGSTAFVIHYPEWIRGAEIDLAIRTELDQLEVAASSETERFYQENQLDEYGTLPADKEEQRDQIVDRNLFYTSMYQTWLKTKQANGLILLISILLGVVFFTFAACILYFRLFGELDRDGKYHRSLYILGVSQADRHKIVTQEMLIMYFVPIVMAIAHFVVAMLCLRLLIALPIKDYILKILLSYLIFQVIFFFISRWRYLKHLDNRAERN